LSVGWSDHKGKSQKIWSTSTTISNGISWDRYKSIGWTNAPWLHNTWSGGIGQADQQLQDSPLHLGLWLQVCHGNLMIDCNIGIKLLWYASRSFKSTWYAPNCAFKTYTVS
jgi:hypothetical protein